MHMPFNPVIPILAFYSKHKISKLKKTKIIYIKNYF